MRHANVTVDEQVAATEVHQESRPAGEGLRIFQFLTAAAGGVLFAMGLIAAVRVDWGADLFDTSAGVAGFGFSAAAAVAAILLGGAILAVALGDQDRGASSLLGLLTLLVGIGALIAEGQIPEEVNVDRRSAGLFIALGAAAFVFSLVPWWSGRRRVTRVSR